MGEATGTSQIISNYSGFLISHLIELGGGRPDSKKTRDLRDRIDSEFQILIANSDGKDFESIRRDYTSLNGGPYGKIIEKVKTYCKELN